MTEEQNSLIYLKVRIVEDMIQHKAADLETMDKYSKDDPITIRETLVPEIE